MSRLPYARSFRDLVVYEKTVSIERELFHASRSFPPEERYSLTDQSRRAVRSIGAQIAEAWAKRRYPAHFASKLTDADAEQMETQHWIGAAVRSGYWTADLAAGYISRLEELGRLLNGMIDRADSFCGQREDRVHEDCATYFASSSLPTDH